MDMDRLLETQVELTRDQKTVVTLLNGQRDVAGVIEDSGLGEFSGASVD